jgi:hypothetical protein
VFLRDLSRLYLVATVIALVAGTLMWAMFLDSMGMARQVPMWRRLWLPRSGTIEGLAVDVPMAYAITPRPRGLRVIYRFPPLTRAQGTFHLQLLSFPAHGDSGRTDKPLKSCTAKPGTCRRWFADAPVNQVPCTEARLGRSDQGDDLGSLGYCRPRFGRVYGVYGCYDEQCATARQILNATLGAPTGKGA